MTPRQIAVVDGFENGKITCTILREARKYAAVGQYVTLQAEGIHILSRLEEFTVTNAVHKDPAFGPIISHKGYIPNWSEDIDVQRSTLEVIGCRDSNGKRVPFRIKPASGTPIMEAAKEEIENFCNEKFDGCRVVIGTAPYSEGLPISIINRSFGPQEKRGYGEARHTMVIGQNGSGKTVLAMLLAALKLIAHPEMGFICPDTAGDISDPTHHDRGEFRFNYKELMDAAEIPLEIIPISEIRLLSQKTLIVLLTPLLVEKVNTKAESAEKLAKDVSDQLFPDEAEVVSKDLSVGKVLDALAICIPRNYSTAATINPKLQAADRLRTSKAFERDLERIRNFFDGRERIDHLINGVVQDGRKIVIQMDFDQGLVESEQIFIMKEVFEQLNRRARATYHKNNKKPCNTLLLLDEAPRWVPESGSDHPTAPIIERTLMGTRKYGLGIMVIGQRMANISKLVLSESHMKWFCRGLGIGADRKHLDACLDKQGCEAYDLLDADGGYFCVGIGQDNNLGSEGKYFAMYPFGGNVNKAIMEANPTLFP